MIIFICNCNNPQSLAGIIYNVIKDLGPFFIAAIVGYIAYRQYIINSNKLRLDLYDKRMEIYGSSD